jgi:NAD+ kinase
MKKITLMPNPYRDRGFQITRSAEQILRQHGAQTQICLPFHMDKTHEIPAGMRFVTMEEGLKNCDLMICLGGDGTILHAARLVGNRDIPMLGINTGTMGFMAELESDELHLLPKVLEGKMTLEKRMMIHVAVKRNGRVIYEDNALNDAVITKGAVARVIQMSVTCDNVEAMHFDGDGLIIATPTGTTAYSISAGGPIVEPTAENIIVTPICAHAMGIRSLVLMRNRVVTAHVGRIGKRNAFLSVDGGKAVRLNAEDMVVVTASRRHVSLAKIKNTSYYSTLSNKFQG